ncbi:MAG: hypothetical protein EON96_19075 [Caulobacteraceae bacterium]|nr:MAG: hypothetical protein EON96_19075 [Caulobacteraceae bacterium]
MLKYRLEVLYPGEVGAKVAAEVDRATEVMTTIRRLLAEHPGCERIKVYAGGGFIFAVDCRGDTVER